MNRTDLAALRRNLTLFKIRKRVVHYLYRRFYRDENRDTSKSILVAGTGRSGTTWLATIIGSQLNCRVMYEPFHSRRVQAFSRFHYFQYARPTEEFPALRSYCGKLFTGNIRDPWIDRKVESLRPEYRLVKAIRANLCLKWIHDRFPEVPIVFIVRHPCAVVLSRIKMDWHTDRDIEAFLAQQPLVDDLLSQRMDVIRGARTPEAKHAIVWCISNLVPMTQFDPGQLNVVFYEKLCLDPEREIPRVFEWIGQPHDDSVFRHARKPSTTAIRGSAVLTGENMLTRWKESLSATQVREILSTVAAFGLDHLYGESPTPIEGA